jgi:signal transduction histidine kinase/putative methionine-R-sulfoxide reductase with GAF domain
VDDRALPAAEQAPIAREEDAFERDAAAAAFALYSALFRRIPATDDPAEWAGVFRAIEASLAAVFPLTGMIPVLCYGDAHSSRVPPCFHLYLPTDGAYEAVYIAGTQMLCHDPDGTWDDLPAAVAGREPTPLESALLERQARSVFFLAPGVPANSDGRVGLGALLALYHTSPAQFRPFHRRVAEHLGPVLLSLLTNVHLSHERRRRALHGRIISQVGAEAIASLPSPAALYQRVVELIQRYFQFYDVAVFQVEWGSEELILGFHAGDYPHYTTMDYRQSVHQGILGHVARSGETYVANDVLSDPIYFNAFPSETSIRSELTVPITFQHVVFAVLDIQSQDVGDFDHYDVESVELLCHLLTRILETADSFEQTRLLKEFTTRALDTIPSAVAVLDQDYRIAYASEQFGTLLDREVLSLLYEPIDAVCSPFLVESEGLHALLEQLSTLDVCGFLSEVRLNESPQSRIVDIRVAKTQEEPSRYVLILDDVTARVHQLEQLAMLQNLGHQLQGTLDLEALLRAVLTCVTAGPGFGFNRAVVFLLDEDDRVLVERLHIGPASHEEAARIWQQLGMKRLEDYLHAAREAGSPEPVQLAARYVRIPVTDEDLGEVAKWSAPFVVRSDEPSSSRLVNSLRHLSEAPEVGIIPLLARSRLVGVILADNMFTRQPVSDRTLQTLSAFASQAALAVSNAVAYRRLEEAFEQLQTARSQLLQHEKLAIIGQLATHVAHEIRNPLVNIGGLARRIVKTGGDTDFSRRAEIIVREVERLELILKDVMDFASPMSFEFQAVDLRELVGGVLSLLEETAMDAGVHMRLEAPAELPSARGDPRRLEQAILNLAKNGIEAMAQGGSLTFRISADSESVVLAVQDTGTGIRPADQSHLFEPFFTTKKHGSGIGLAVTRNIIQQHGGTVEAHSAPEQGTTFTITLARFHS